jgi:hypothetical protein
MRQKRPEYTLVTIALFGVSRQAYYLARHKAARTSIAHMIVLTLVGEFRATSCWEPETITHTHSGDGKARDKDGTGHGI